MTQERLTRLRINAERILNGSASEDGDYIFCAEAVAEAFLSLTNQNHNTKDQ